MLRTIPENRQPAAHSCNGSVHSLGREGKASFLQKKLGSMETHDVRQGFVPSEKSLGLWRPTTYCKGLFLQEKAWVYGDPRRTVRGYSFIKSMGLWRPTTYGAQSIRRRTGKVKKNESKYNLITLLVPSSAARVFLAGCGCDQ